MKMKCFHYPQSFTLIIDLKLNFQYQNINLRYISVVRNWSHKEHSCFDLPAHSVFIFHVFWGRLCTNILGNSCSAVNNIRSRLPSRLSFKIVLSHSTKSSIKEQFSHQKHVILTENWLGSWKTTEKGDAKE